MIDLLVIQPTPFCNIDCTYCYLPARANTKKISLDTLQKIMERVRAENLAGEAISIVWHAGEPLTVNVDYFAAMLQLIAQTTTGMHVNHAIQTNGMLITQKWCDLIRQFDIRIGISLDGPGHINDKHRLSRSGQGTFDKTMRGVALLQQNNIPYHAIAVITRHALAYPDEVFDFFKSNGFYQLGLNIEEIEGAHQASSLEHTDMDRQVAHFFKTIFERYMTSDRSMGIREFDNAFSAVLRNPEIPDIRKQTIYSHQTSVLGIVSVDYEGNFSTFSPELLGQQHAHYTDFNLGNVHHHTFGDAIASRKFKTIASDIEKGIKRCKKECSYFYVCGGGAPANKLYENGSFNSTETLYCKYTIQAPLDVVLAHLEKVTAGEAILSSSATSIDDQTGRR